MTGPVRTLWSILGLISVVLSGVNAGRVLLFPYGHGFTSRLVDMRNMGYYLSEAGHNVTILVNQEDRVHLEKVPKVNFYIYSAPPTRNPFIADQSRKDKFMKSDSSVRSMTQVLNNLLEAHATLCEELLKHKVLLEQLKDEQFDLLIVDFVESCGRVLSIYLGVPTMAYSSTGLVHDPALFPNLPSIVPTPFSKLTSRMTFIQRVKNFCIMFAIKELVEPSFIGTFEDLQQKYGINQGENTRSLTNAFTDQMYVSHTDFVLEDSRPLLPNVVLVGGMHVPNVQPLEAHIKDFMDGAGRAGVVLVSFGSLIDQMDASKTELIAGVLGTLKQRVIWRLASTVAPPNLANNTMLLDWLPQNDLLAHPNTKVFITHCGIHGTYEALHHGVPVVAIPLMFDQHDNAVKLTKNAQMGVHVDMHTMTSTSLEHGIRQVLDEVKYKERAVYNSQLLKDHPLTAKQRFIFYAEYMMRHKGAARLTCDALTDLSTLQLYCVDVLGFLFTIFIILISIIFILLRTCWRCIRRNIFMGSKQKES